jgi:glycosyltransferase involved in cell wall biosynthesis
VITVHLVVPDTIEDPASPSGGNTYDRQVRSGLKDLGLSVRQLAIPGPWPRPDGQARAALARALGAIPDGGVALIDGLIASAAPEVLLPQADRVRIVVLVHMPLGGELNGARLGPAGVKEHAVLLAAAAVVTTSEWTHDWLLDHYALDSSRLHIAEPGTETAPLAPGTPDGANLLCVGAVTHGKGHDLLVTALAEVGDLPWTCVCAGSLTLAPDFVRGLVEQAWRRGIADRVRFVGTLVGEDLDRAYAVSDVLLLASRSETYGLVVTEALARGIPVVGMSVGGVPEALGRASDGSIPGLLVPSREPGALARALRSWLHDAGLRDRLRDAARDRRLTLPTWAGTSKRIADVLETVAA